MQKVACPTTIVRSERSQCRKTKNELSAMPVRIPGSAIGRARGNETVSRPEKPKRAIAVAAAVPRTSATPVARRPALTESQSACRTSSERHATWNHRVVKPGIGHDCTFDELKA